MLLDSKLNLKNVRTTIRSALTLQISIQQYAKMI